MLEAGVLPFDVGVLITAADDESSGRESGESLPKEPIYAGPLAECDVAPVVRAIKLDALDVLVAELVADELAAAAAATAAAVFEGEAPAAVFGTAIATALAALLAKLEYMPPTEFMAFW
jgi:hypothetical protein